MIERLRMCAKGTGDETAAVSCLSSAVFCQSNNQTMRKGSALLIVLGMLAFMVISAVAFSAFMRFSRMPSSYLRRTSSSRHLVKAALAEAIR